MNAIAELNKLLAKRKSVGKRDMYAKLRFGEIG
jgi:hypothetical protein